MKRFALAIGFVQVLVIAAAIGEQWGSLAARAQAGGGLPTAKGPVYVTCPDIDVRIECPGCLSPGRYYSGFKRADWFVHVEPMYRVSPPPFVYWDVMDSTPTSLHFYTLDNLDSAFMSGTLTIGDHEIHVDQEGAP